MCVDIMYYHMIQKSRETDSPNFLVHILILKGNKYGQKALVYTKLTEIYICCENSMTVIVLLHSKLDQDNANNIPPIDHV